MRSIDFQQDIYVLSVVPRIENKNIKHIPFVNYPTQDPIKSLREEMNMVDILKTVFFRKVEVDGTESEPMTVDEVDADIKNSLGLMQRAQYDFYFNKFPKSVVYSVLVIKTLSRV